MEESWGDLIKQLFWEMTPQTNYHGSQYTFDKFDDSKFLTGEGFAAHGPGHYSADLLDTAERYKKPTVSVLKNGNKIERNLISPNFVDRIKDTKINLPDIFDDQYKYELDRINNALEKATQKYNNGMKFYKPLIERLETQLDFMNNMDDYSVSRSTGNLYKVNVPNENFMWKEGLPLSEQTPYVRDAWYKNDFDYSKLLKYYDAGHDMEGITLPKDRKFWRAWNKSYDLYGELRPSLKRIFNDQMQSLDVPQQLKFLSRSGNLDKLSEAMGDIKGIRAIGNTDGPINITFSGKDIKMANTPWQQIKNRIPKETLGKMVTKAMNSPVAKGIGTGLAIANELNPLFFAYGLGEAANAWNTRYGKPINVAEHMKEYDKLKNIPMSITAPQKKQLYWTQGHW